MEIFIASSAGSGSTKLSAFDNALFNAGVHNYNLIPLSSVIPPQCTIHKVERYAQHADEFGHRLYVVMAEMRGDKKGLALGAGIGWYQFGDGRGLFVEHHMSGIAEEDIKKQLSNRIHGSLKDMCSYRKIAFDDSLVGSVISTVAVNDVPRSALSVAVYKSQGWT